MTMYKIVRHYFNDSAKRVIKRGLTLEQAQAHCADPETSSRTATSAAARARTRKHGPWFDGYAAERPRNGQRRTEADQNPIGYQRVAGEHYA